jgi:hypothetical protein
MTTRTVRIPWPGPGRRLSALLTVTVLALSAVLLIAGCSGGSNGQKVEGAAQSAGTALQDQNQPVPIFPTSALRYNLILIEAIQALGTPTTTFFFPPGAAPNSGVTPIGSCPSQGEPIPNTASLTNPLQPYQGGVTTDGGDVVGQEDPVGIYTPTSSSGTYVLCLTASGGVTLHYWEGDVYTVSGTAVWDAATHSVQQIGPSQLPVCTVLAAQPGDGTGLSQGTRYYHCIKA